VQVCGLLASEHAIVAPVLCVVVAFLQKESWRSATLAPWAVLRGSDAVRHATIDGGKPTRVFLPMNNGTRSIFGSGEAHTFLPGMPAHVTLYKKGEEIDPGPNDVVVKTLPPLKSGEPMPYWSERWDWLRRLARIR
jgi:hypothetical protein